MQYNEVRRLAGLPLVAEAQEDPEFGIKDDNTKDTVVAFLKKNPMPKDEEIHTLAKKLNVTPDQLEEVIYNLLAAMLAGVGKHNDVADTEFDHEQLKMGIAVEFEHTNDAYVAKLIAKDHLAEIPNYYTLLKDMEKKAGVKD